MSRKRGARRRSSARRRPATPKPKPRQVGGLDYPTSKAHRLGDLSSHFSALATSSAEGEAASEYRFGQYLEALVAKKVVENQDEALQMVQIFANTCVKRQIKMATGDPFEDDYGDDEGLDFGLEDEQPESDDPGLTAEEEHDDEVHFQESLAALPEVDTEKEYLREMGYLYDPESGDEVESVVGEKLSGPSVSEPKEKEVESGDEYEWVDNEKVDPDFSPSRSKPKGRWKAGRGRKAGTGRAKKVLEDPVEEPEEIEEPIDTDDNETPEQPIKSLTVRNKRATSPLLDDTPSKVSKARSTASPRKARKPTPKAKPKAQRTPTKKRKLAVASRASTTEPEPESEKEKEKFGHKSSNLSEDDMTRPRCQPCLKMKKGCDRQRPCMRCSTHNRGYSQCIPELRKDGTEWKKDR